VFYRCRLLFNSVYVGDNGDNGEEISTGCIKHGGVGSLGDYLEFYNQVGLGTPLTSNSMAGAWE
jgi:hypothetical protein